MHNGVVDPNSIPDSDDPFLQDFKAVASHDQMVIVTCSDSYNYINDYEEIQLYEFPDKNTPVDFQDPVEVKGYCLETGCLALKYIDHFHRKIPIHQSFIALSSNPKARQRLLLRL